MKSHVSEEKVTDEHSSVQNCADVDHKPSKDTQMDASSDCTFICSTPHISRRDNASATLSTQSIFSVDSGFSDGTFDSTWMSSTSAQSCPELENECSRRLTLQASEFSPINRGSSTSILGRRLEFSSFYLQPLPPSESSPQENNESSEVDKGEDISSLKSPESLPTMNSFSVVSTSTSSSLNSNVTYDLEASLQEMILGESPSVSTRTSPLPFVITNCDRIRLIYREEENNASQLCVSNKNIKTNPELDQCQTYETGIGESQADDLNVSSSSNLPLQYSESTNKLENAHITNLDTETFKLGVNIKTTFFNKLLLAPSGSEQSQSLTFDSVFKKSLSKVTSEHATHTESVDHVNISISDNKPVLSDYRVPPLPCTCTAPTSTSDHSEFSEKQQPHDCKICNNVNTPAVKSQSKRSCDCEEDCSLLFSPTKVRKTEYFPKRSPPKEQIISPKRSSHKDLRSVISSPMKHVSRKILHDKEGSYALKCSASVVCEQGPFSLTFSSLLTPVETTAICIKNIDVDTVCDEQTTSSTGNRLSSGQVLEVITPKDTLKPVGSAKDRLHKVLVKFSPPEPSRLIGRNVGVDKFDILPELHCRNFELCLSKIFQHVADTDLVSVARVSHAWKMAMFSDLKAYNRYRQHMRSLSSCRLQRGSGKENSGEKPTDAHTVESLTQPRGLLASMQSQAKVKVIPELAPAVTVKDNLLFDDALRICPRCQGPALIKHCQDRATCMSDKCLYDFCTLCFSSYHHPRRCKPLCKAPSKADVAGTRKSKKNLKRL